MNTTDLDHVAQCRAIRRSLTESTAPPLRRPSPLPIEEWDFRECPSDERELCLAYELSREISEWGTMVYNDRQMMLRRASETFCREPSVLWIWFGHLHLPLSFHEWPDTPWMKLPPSIRQERGKRDALSSLRFGLSCHPPGAPTFPSSFDHSYSDTKILADVVSYLLKFRAETGLKPKQRRGNRSAADVLKSLGVLRLMRELCGWEKAQDAFRKAGIETYKDQAAWLHTRRRAKQDIVRFHETGSLVSVLRKCN